MGVFKDQVLTWNGADYVIPAGKVMGCIETIEDALTLYELMEMKAKGPKLSRIARAFAAALNYAASLNRDLPRVETEAVYQGMFAGEAAQETVTTALTTLLMMMVPPSVVENAAKGRGAADATPGNAPNRKSRRAAAASSKKPTKPA